MPVPQAAAENEVRLAFVVADARCQTRTLFGYGPVCNTRLSRVEMSPALERAAQACGVTITNGEHLCCSSGACGIATARRLLPLLGILR